jgi:hypothetical protein
MIILILIGKISTFKLLSVTNKTLLRTLKLKLNQKKGALMEYVPEVLLSYQTTTRTLTGVTPISLTYGTDAVISIEVGSPSFRVSHYNPGLNDEGINLHLDLLQEQREEAQITWATYQGRVAQYYNKMMNPRKFQIGDWVMRKVNLITKDLLEGKLTAKWEGPYWVVKCHDKGAYHLVTAEGKPVSRAWNAKHLKKYYL